MAINSHVKIDFNFPLTNVSWLGFMSYGKDIKTSIVKILKCNLHTFYIFHSESTGDLNTLTKLKK